VTGGTRSSPVLEADVLLEELDRPEDGVAVVAFGGGHGLACALRAILDYAGKISAIVTVADDGGSSGRLSPDLGIPPPGDIRRALLALSPRPSLWRELMAFRFEDADVAGHSLGNLLLAALTDITGDFEEALHTAGGMLGARGEVIPAARRPLVLEAVVDGRVVRGQVAIATAAGPPSELRLVPEEAEATPAALAAVASADQIVLGPGSLFTSVIAGLKVGALAEAINAASARLVYVCNLTTQDGETLGLSGADHVAALSAHGGIRPPDAVVVHDGPLTVPPGLTRVTGDDITVPVESADLADPSAEWPAHDPTRLGAVLRRLA
jgi:uncharacterized cofD-like protein